MSIELRPEVEARLRETAARFGLSLEVYLVSLAERGSRFGGAAEWASDAEERYRLLHEWAQSHSTAATALPDEPLQRESFYPDRGTA